MGLFEKIKPVLVLTVICLVVTSALSYTNAITAPIIDQNEKEANNRSRLELIPTADTFVEVPMAEDVMLQYNGMDVYKAQNGAGYTVSAYGKGFGGKLGVMVAFSPEGDILATKVIQSSETPGLGTRISEPSYSDQFLGKNGVIGQEEMVFISGATISSKAMLAAVNNAAELFAVAKEAE